MNTYLEVVTRDLIFGKMIVILLTMWWFVSSAVIVCLFGPRFVKSLFKSVIGPKLGLNMDLRTTGQWAVVTGATDGIGKAYCQELARIGLDIILISRSLPKLKTVASEIEAEFGVRTKIIDIDFTNGPDIYERIRTEIDGLEIGILINNVGMSYPYPEFFLNIANGDKICHDMINCNITSVTLMTRMLLPQMVQRRKGVIVNVASAAGVLPSPLLSTYSATKAFMERFSQNLSWEYGKQGVFIQCILPFFVATNMSRTKHPSRWIPSATDYVQEAIKTIGLERRTAGYIPHKLMLFLSEMGSFLFPTLVFKMSLNKLNHGRKRIMKKYTQNNAITAE